MHQQLLIIVDQESKIIFPTFSAHENLISMDVNYANNKNTRPPQIMQMPRDEYEMIQGSKWRRIKGSESLLRFGKSEFTRNCDIF